MTKESVTKDYPEIPFTISPESLYKDYVKSKSWKCKQSPSGAHYWIVKEWNMKCKYCNSHKRIDKLQVRVDLKLN